MREINAGVIQDNVQKLFASACCDLGCDVENSIKKALDAEKASSGKKILQQLLENINIAREDNIPLCQDTGMAVVFLEIGQDVHITGGYLYEAVNQGVRLAYKNGCFRKSVVKSPIFRENTLDNTPAIIHTDIIPGDKIKIIAMPKGFGSENMSAVKMLKPSDGVEGIKSFVLDTVIKAGANPCPPVILGIGIGGTLEMCTLLSKKALLRDMSQKSSDKYIASLEDELLDDINKTGIGPQGLGGKVTCLKVNILTYPTHIAGLPVSVNMQCHASRHREITI
ncbi:MAG: fumarate hydratase [Clostridiales bacterium]|nr:fumarate hydratase [Clostridiales bacterium]